MDGSLVCWFVVLGRGRWCICGGDERQETRDERQFSFIRLFKSHIVDVPRFVFWEIQYYSPEGVRFAVFEAGLAGFRSQERVEARYVFAGRAISGLSPSFPSRSYLKGS